MFDFQVIHYPDVQNPALDGHTAWHLYSDDVHYCGFFSAGSLPWCALSANAKTVGDEYDTANTTSICVGLS